MHDCKELLLACESIANKLTASVANIVEQFNSDKVIRDNHGRVLNLPQVPDLLVDANTFLSNANKVVRLLCLLPGRFTQLKEDSNFDKLALTLAAALPVGSKLTEFVTAEAPVIRRIVELRNFAEHPKQKKTEIHNFEAMPSGKIRVPVWGFSEDDFIGISDEMKAIIGYLMRIAESMLIGSLEQCREKSFPAVLVREISLNLECPIAFRYCVDTSKLKFPDPP